MNVGNILYVFIQSVLETDLVHCLWFALFSNSFLMGNSLVVQWSGLCAFTAEGPGSSPALGTKFPQAMGHDQKLHTHTHTHTHTHKYFPCDLRHYCDLKYYFSPTSSMKTLKTTVAHPILFLNTHKFRLLIALLGDQSLKLANIY